jgi:hypothetical protein
MEQGSEVGAEIPAFAGMTGDGRRRPTPTAAPGAGQGRAFIVAPAKAGAAPCRRPGEGRGLGVRGSEVGAEIPAFAGMTGVRGSSPTNPPTRD